MKAKDLTGRQFGRLTVTKFSHINKYRQSVWECRCVCGNKTTVVGGQLVSGHIKGCGCLQGGVETHGMTHSRLYRIWIGMKTRCENPTEPDYHLYGGRGIAICDEWKDFAAFNDWAMSNGYRDDLSIDRKNTDGDYCPENCRWATMKEQQNNRRNNRLITHNGKTQSLAQWSAELGISRHTLNSRINLMGWSAERALTEPVHHKTSH